MREQLRHLGLTGALALAVLLAACSSGDGDPTQAASGAGDTAGTEASATAPSDGGGASTSDVSVTSEDGGLTVNVPAGAGPADVAITLVDAPAEFADLDGVSVVAAYELGPDGAAFTEPITIEFQTAASGAGALPLLLPVISTVDGNGFELPDDIAVSEDDDGNVNLSASISHFSSLIYVKTGDGFQLTPAPLRLRVGETGRFALDGSKSNCPTCMLALTSQVVVTGESLINTTTGRFAPSLQAPPITCVLPGTATLVVLGSVTASFLETVVTLGTGKTKNYGLGFTTTVECVEEGPISLSFDALTMVYADRTISGLPTPVDQAAPTVFLLTFMAEPVGVEIAFSGTFQEPADGAGAILVEAERADGLLVDWFIQFERQADGSIAELIESLFYDLDGGVIDLRPDVAGSLDGAFRVEVPFEFDGTVLYAPLVGANGELLDPARIQIDRLFFTFRVGEDGATWELEVEPLIEALRR